MKDRRKILLGTKDVAPQENKDLFLNLEIHRSPDELQTEIVNNDFNLKDQFNSERRTSLKFCVYGTLDCITANLDNINLQIKTNHDDLLYTPRIEANAKANIITNIQAKPLSKNNKLSQNIFKKNKGCFFFLFELSPSIKNFGETKSLEITIDDKVENVYAKLEVPFLFFDDDGNLVDFGTDTVDIDLNGEEQVIENDFPFLYGTHWIKKEFNLPRPLYLSFRRSIDSNINNLTVEEKVGKTSFVVSLEEPSIYGIEEAEVCVISDTTVKNPNEDYVFEPKKLSWKTGEQFKTVDVDIVDDLFTESNEMISFGLKKVKNAIISDDKSDFNLTIQNDDTPSIVSFENFNAEIVSDQNVIELYLESDKPIRVPGQSIELVLDKENSTVIIGKDIENTGTEDNPGYRKTIPLQQGLDLFEFEINIQDNLQYDFTKKAVFKLENPTQNIKTENATSKFTLTIKDSMITRYTSYIIDSNRKRGQGIFRLDNPTPTNLGQPISFANSKVGDPTLMNHTVTSDFAYTLNVINDGERIIFGDKIVGSGETVVSIDSKDGYQNFEFKLPSNCDINEQNKYFEKSKYKFIISDIKKSFGAIFGSVGSDVELANTYDDFEINSTKLESSEVSGKTYYLTSDLIGVRTRLKYLGNSSESEIKTYNYIVDAGILPEDTFQQRKQKLIDTGQFDIVNNTPYTTQTNGNQVDNAQVSVVLTKIKKYQIDYPTFSAPKSFRDNLFISSDIIDCKINGLLLLSNLYYKTNNSQNSILNNFFNNNNNNNSIPNSRTKVQNVVFKENPIEYTYFPNLSIGGTDLTAFNNPPVEPIFGE
tara:strand:+ start:547 stop:3003 length:2457 start_codon:yes stop_codon:yes gene_type:complete